jgi:hypothetical protein
VKLLSIPRNPLIGYMDQFVFAGSTALLIGAAHLNPRLWFLTLFGLIPFLWRVARASPRGSVVLGILLGISYGFLFRAGAPLFGTGSVDRLLVFALLFGPYSLLVNQIIRHSGRNVIFLAASWLPVEYVLTCLCPAGCLFSLRETDSAFLLRICSLFGVLAVSFLIVLANVLILLLTEYLTRRRLACRGSFSDWSCPSFLPYRCPPFVLRAVHTSHPRAPPPPAASQGST